MEILDWIVLSTTLFFIVIYGALKTKGSANVKDYLLDNNETPWFTVGSFHHFVSIIRLEFEYVKHYHWNFGNYIYCNRWNKSRECDSKATNVCDYEWYVHHFLLHFSEFTSRS